MERNKAHLGDARELAAQLPDGSVDLIFTDPPYPQEFLPLYKWLAEESARLLKPGGFVLVYTPDLYMNKIMRWFDDKLTFFSPLSIQLKGPYPMIWSSTTLASIRHILAFSNGKSKPRVGGMLTSYTGKGAMKLYHAWGQDVASARYFIDHFVEPGQLVLDPFIGGGTAAVACELLNVDWVGFDNDPASIAATNHHLSGEMAPFKKMSLFDFVLNGKAKAKT